MLSLDTGRRCLVLTQLGIPDFADPPKGGLTPSEEWIGGGGNGETREGEEGELGLVCKIKIILNKKI